MSDIHINMKYYNAPKEGNYLARSGVNLKQIYNEKQNNDHSV